MRSFAALALALLFTALPALAQDTPAPPAAAGLPKGPIPYAVLNPAPKPGPTAPARPRPTTASPTTLAPVPALPVTPAGARLAPADPLPPAELEAYVDGVVKDAMDREHIAGVTISVVQNGQVILKKGYGFASLKPQRRVDPDRTLFRLGSISKTFTWITLMNEVDAGRIRINAPVNLYLPEQLQIKDEGFRQQVRIAHLMQHAPGFEDRALGQLFEMRYDRVRPLAEYLRQERPRRVFAPGAVASYSNYGAALAGEAVSYVSDKTFERVAEDEIFAPLGLWRTTFREPHPGRAGMPAPMPAALVPDISVGYRWTPGGYVARPFEFIGQVGPAGSASSTAGDMSRYMLLLLGDGTLDGVTVFGPRPAKAFRTPLRKTPPGINGWAHGFVVNELPGGHRGYGHNGATLSFMSNMVVVPDLDLGVFISTNTETGAGLAGRLPERIVRQFYATPQTFPRPGSPDLVENRGLYEGYYVSTRRAYGGLEAFVTLIRAGAAITVTPDGRLSLSGQGPTLTFAPEGDPTAGRFIATAGEQRLAFTLEKGKARSFLTSGGAVRFERAPFWKKPGALVILAIATAIASLATLGGIFLRNRREFRQTTIQSRASLVQNSQAALWLVSGVLFAVWASKVGDIAQVMYGWPGPSLLIASACALVSAALTIITLVCLPAIWRGGRRVDSWTQGRKLFFTVTVLIYTAFSAVLWTWGALSPWGG